MYKQASINQKNIFSAGIARLADEYHLADVYVFGSRAKEIAAMVRDGRTSEKSATSDVDIGVCPIHGRRLAPREIIGLTLSLEDLLGANRVDLVVLPKADPFLALEIIRGELVYTRNATEQARHELYILRRAGDLSPLKKARMQIIMDGHG